METDLDAPTAGFLIEELEGRLALSAMETKVPHPGRTVFISMMLEGRLALSAMETEVHEELRGPLSTGVGRTTRAERDGNQIPFANAEHQGTLEGRLALSAMETSSSARDTGAKPSSSWKDDSR